MGRIDPGRRPAICRLMSISARGIQKSFPGPDGPITVLAGVDLDVKPGSSVALTGESGSGKSTLLHILAGLEPADAGEVVISGQPLGPMTELQKAKVRRESLGIVFQQFNLIPSLTVAQNITFQARLAGREDAALAERLARELGIADQLEKYPEDLSGGQQQRVAIGRALAAAPKVLLADEPTGNLDEDTAARVFGLMRDLAGDIGAALLVATHSELLASSTSRRLHLSRGRIE